MSLFVCVCLVCKGGRWSVAVREGWGVMIVLQVVGSRLRWKMELTEVKDGGGVV